MAHNSGFVQVFPDQGGKKIETDTHDLGGGNLVHRQRIRLGGHGLEDLAEVVNNKLEVNSHTPGTNADAASDEDADGLITLTGGADSILQIPVISGTYYIESFTWAADCQCQFSLEIRDSGALTKTIRVIINSGSHPSDTLYFRSPVPVAGVANRDIRLVVKRLSGSSGQASGGINGYTI